MITPTLTRKPQSRIQKTNPKTQNTNSESKFSNQTKSSNSKPNSSNQLQILKFQIQAPEIRSKSSFNQWIIPWEHPLPGTKYRRKVAFIYSCYMHFCTETLSIQAYFCILSWKTYKSCGTSRRKHPCPYRPTGLRLVSIVHVCRHNQLNQVHHWYLSEMWC